MDIDSGFKPKSFWAKPEGTTGMIALALLGVAGFFALGHILPFLIGILTMGIAAVGKAIALTILCAALAGIFYVVTNPKFLALTSYMFKSIMRKATGLFVEIDPIGIMLNYVRNMKDRLLSMDTAIEKLNGQLRICKQKIQYNQKGQEQALAMAKEAKAQDKAAIFTVNARQAGRLEKLNNETLIPMQRTMDMTLRALRKYREVTETVILDMQNEVEAKKAERDMILTSHSAMRSAQAILTGDADKKELFDQAMEYVVNDYGQKIGEIENFIETSQTFVDGLDLQNGVFEQDALKKLQEWETKADSLLLGDKKRQLLEQVDMLPPTVIDVAPVSEKERDFSKFLGKGA
jgi:hypothetical protein